MNKTVKGLVLLAGSFIANTEAELKAQQPIDYRGPGIQIGGFDIYRKWSLKTEIIQAPVYQQFDTYARTPCGPQYVGSSCIKVGTTPIAV
ncbi:MAG: hypothetical protein QXW97_02435, partial [Candidatus Pacearchaeota archaeon]